MEELWRDAVGYEGSYQVSNTGRVKSIQRTIAYKRHGEGIEYFTKEKFLKQSENHAGYLRVSLCKNGKKYNWAVHRLVAFAFIPNPQNKEEVNHINGNKKDNKVENLERNTSSENKRHGFATKLYKRERAVLQLQDGKVINEFPSLKEAAKQFSKRSEPIRMACLGKTKHAYGYEWKFKE